MNADTPRTKIDEDHWQYSYLPVYLNDDKKEIVGWKLVCNQHWMPLRDPPRLIDQFQLAYYDCTFTTMDMKLKWRNRSAQEFAYRMYKHMEGADFK